MTTKSGQLAQGNWNGDCRVLKQIHQPLYGVTCKDGLIAAVGGSGILLIGADDRFEKDVIDVDAQLTSIAPVDGHKWMIGSNEGHRTGSLLLGERGAWSRLTGVRMEEMQAVAHVIGDTYLAAGTRGLLVRAKGTHLEKLSTHTDHPLRVLATNGHVTYAGGGGWAQDMPILLKVEAESVTPLIVAGGTRVIVGLAVRGEELWIAEMRPSKNGWDGFIHSLSGEDNFEVSVLPNQRIRGLACIDNRLVVWGDGGYLGWMRLDPSKCSDE